MFRSGFLATAIVSVSLFAIGSLGAQRNATVPATSAGEDEYVRISKTDSGEPKGLDTAIIRFKGEPGTPLADTTIDLIGVVHIGQEEYYEDLKKRLATYDVVLYELVAPDGTRIRPEDLQARRSVLASLQTGMKDMLNLEYQLEKIDYMAKNFRHADMSPEEFMQHMEERGDSMPNMLARMMGAGIATQSDPDNSNVGLLTALFSKDRAMMLKRAMAKQLSDMEIATAGMDDENGDNTLIKGRNEKAFEVMKDELKKGHKSIAVFYGAGHLKDMDERLQRDFQMVPVETTWLQAWDLQRN